MQPALKCAKLPLQMHVSKSASKEVTDGLKY